MAGRRKGGSPSPQAPDPDGGGTPKPQPQPRSRVDGFTPAKKERFFAALERYKCIADAAFAVQVSRKTVDYHRRKFPDFAAQVAMILDKAVRPLENTAWQRATVGGEEKIWRDGKLVQVKVKPSDAMLRLLLQARHPKKYGRLSRGGETKKQIEKRLRKAIEAELEEKYRPRHADLDEMCLALARRLKQFPPIG